ncbi:MAG: hypothetical protein O2972_08175 [Cyanobacteria bacterium]|nr:hypothetical protein [Cyanobacteriota bacterium]
MHSVRFGALALLISALTMPAKGFENDAQPHPTLASAAIAADASLLVLERTTRRLSRTADPIWVLSLNTPGKSTQSFEVVTGRAHRQNADRHRTGTRAPLPAGRYSLGPVEPLGPGDPMELGPIWIGIEPLFPTGRGHLGIHLDPSANRNANSGTLGCVGLINRADMFHLASLIEQRQVRELVVLD